MIKSWNHARLDAYELPNRVSLPNAPMSFWDAQDQVHLDHQQRAPNSWYCRGHLSKIMAVNDLDRHTSCTQQVCVLRSKMLETRFRTAFSYRRESQNMLELRRVFVLSL